MKFKSRIDSLYVVGAIVFTLFMAIVMIVPWFTEPEPPDESLIFIIVVYVTTAVLTALPVICLFTTRYDLSDGYLRYRSGPFTGKIEISRIREIEKGKTMWTGTRPSTARNGLIIRYDKFEDIYISPDSNESFVNAILKIQNDIVITYKKKPLD